MSEADPALKFLTLGEVAGALQVSKRTLFRLIYQRRMPALKVGGQWRVSESRFKEWIKDADITLGPE